MAVSQVLVFPPYSKVDTIKRTLVVFRVKKKIIIIDLQTVICQYA